MDLVVDAREHQLIEDLKEYQREGVHVVTENMELGDVLIRKEDRALLLIERKSVRDLIASLKDHRYHDQRRRWKEFLVDMPNARVALWIEGDLMASSLDGGDNKIIGSLVNSLHRLQSLHGILVYQISGRKGFLKSLDMMLEKFQKDPDHLVCENSNASCYVDLKKYKKTPTDLSSVCLWQNVLAMVPGVSASAAAKIIETFPTRSSLMDSDGALQTLADIKTSSRRLGVVIAGRILDLIRGM